HELPEKLDLDWYRKQARALLRAHASGDAEAQQRVHDALGEGSASALKLGDAQRVLAREHGFRNWAELKRWIETRTPEPHVGRIGRAPIKMYDERAEALQRAVEQGDTDARRRVQAHVARLR